MSTLMLVGGVFSVILAGKSHAADPVADLTDRLRNPRRRIVWAITHPIIAVKGRRSRA